jgi:hypothetical protein
MPQVHYSKYGKDNVRVYKVEKQENGVHNVYEFTVKSMLEGDIDTSSVNYILCFGWYTEYHLDTQTQTTQSLFLPTHKSRLPTSWPSRTR